LFFKNKDVGPHRILEGFAQRSKEVKGLILTGFLLGPSTSLAVTSRE